MAAALSILAIATGAADDEAVIAVATDLARRRPGSLLVADVFIQPIVFAPPLAATAALPVLHSVADEVADARGRVATMLHNHLGAVSARLGSSTVRLADSNDTAWEALMRELPLADMVVLGQSHASSVGSWSGPLGESLMSAKAPVLVVRGSGPAAGRPAAVAWDGSLQAGRAVRAALPLLEEASEVLILQHRQEIDTQPGSRADPARLSAYLSAHGLPPGTVCEAPGRSVGQALLGAAQRAKAALLVAGAYGHSRLGEALFGGATKAMLTAEEGPHLFIAH